MIPTASFGFALFVVYSSISSFNSLRIVAAIFLPLMILVDGVAMVAVEILVLVMGKKAFTCYMGSVDW